jgi:hypothetical protein
MGYAENIREGADAGWIQPVGVTGVRCLILVGGLFAFPLLLQAQEERGREVIEPAPPESAPAAPADEASPAVPDGEEPPAEPAENAEATAGAGGHLARLEWRGLIAMGRDVQFSLHDPSAQVSFWIGFNELRYGVEVAGYDAEEGVLTLREGEEVRDLSLSGATVATLPNQAPATEPPALAMTPETNQEEAPAEEGPSGELADEARRVAALWQEAVEDTPRLQEVDARLRELRLESERVATAMTQVPQDAPEFQSLRARLGEVREEERRLSDVALNEVPASPELREQITQPQGEALRDQLFGGRSPREDAREGPVETPPAEEQEVADPMPIIVDEGEIGVDGEEPDPQADEEEPQEDPAVP